MTDNEFRYLVGYENTATFLETFTINCTFRIKDEITSKIQIVVVTCPTINLGIW
jgi:uncharacterized protein (UPF0333 family)